MSLFKRLLNPKAKSDDSKDQADTSSYYPQDKLPADEKFTHIFKKNGGKFIYCENEDELVEAFDSIMLENDWYEQEAFCTNNELMQTFKGFNLEFGKNPESTFLLCNCESLIAANGSILLCSNQLKEKKLNELPSNFIILGRTSNIVENISEGLRKIKNQSQHFIPSNITTIQDFETEKEKDFMTYGSSTKNLYLLLLEDL